MKKAIAICIIIITLGAISAGVTYGINLYGPNEEIPVASEVNTPVNEDTPVTLAIGVLSEPA